MNQIKEDKRYNQLSFAECENASKGSKQHSQKSNTEAF